MFPKSGMGGLMKQAQKMQKDMQKAQEELVFIEVEGTSGGGMVTVKANAKLQILSIKIEEDVLKDDSEMVEDLVLAAVNQALTKAQDAASEKMAGITGGLGNMGIPGF
jgi:nucleoid-associated protein EbfC